MTLKINVEFKDFDRTMMRRPEFRRHRWTSAQRSKFAWPEDKKREWVGKFSQAVADGWKEKHAFVLDEPGFEKYRAVCDVKVQHVDKPEEANTKVTAQWVPPGAPRLRSSVGGGGATAELDARDVDEPETHKLPAVAVVRQIGPFDYDSSELNADRPGGYRLRSRRRSGDSRNRAGRWPGRPTTSSSASPAGRAHRVRSPTTRSSPRPGRTR